MEKIIIQPLDFAADRAYTARLIFRAWPASTGIRLHHLIRHFMRIAILGGPGADAQTQAKLLAARHRVPQISPLALLQNAVAKAGKKTPPPTVRPADDEQVMALLDERLRARDSRRGFIIDGFPSNIPQAQALDGLLDVRGSVLQIALYVQVDAAELVKRLISQLACEACRATHNRYYSPPKIRGVCDQCGGKLLAKSHPRAPAAQARVAAYHEEGASLLAYYKAQHKLRTVPATGPAAQTQQKINDIVDLEIRPLEVKALETAAETFDEGDTTIIAGGQINRIAAAPKPAAASMGGEAAAAVVEGGAEAAKVTAKTPAGAKPRPRRASRKAPARASAAKSRVRKTAPKTPGAAKAAPKKPMAQKAAPDSAKPTTKFAVFGGMRASSAVSAFAKTFAAAKAVVKKAVKKVAQKAAPKKPTAKKPSAKK